MPPEEGVDLVHDSCLRLPENLVGPDTQFNTRQNLDQRAGALKKSMESEHARDRESERERER